MLIRKLTFSTHWPQQPAPHLQAHHMALHAAVLGTLLPRIWEYPVDEEIRRWKDDLWSIAAEEPEISRSAARTNVSGRNEIPIPDSPAESELHLFGVGEQFAVVTLRLGERAPKSLFINAGAALSRLVFEGEGAVDMKLWLRGPDEAIEIGGVRAERMRLESGYAILFPTSHVQVLELLDHARLDAGNSQLATERLHLWGAVHIGNQGVMSRETQLHGSVTITVEGDSQFGRIAMDDGESLTLQGGTSRAAAIPEGATVEVENATLQLLRADEPIKGLCLVGRGVIQCDGHLHEPILDGDELLLSLAPGALVVDVRGRGAIRAGTRSLCIGSQTDPFYLQRVDDVAGAELEHVAVYDLEIEDLRALEQTTRLSVWLPRGRRRRRQTREREENMRLGMASDGHSNWQQRAFFWSRLSVLLKERHAPGAIQSEVRYAAARARRKALSLGDPEKWYLALYWLVGFGERVLRPLLDFAIVTLVLAIALEPSVWQRGGIVDALGGVAETWGRAGLSVITFFRPGGEPFLGPIDGLGMKAALLVVQVLGLVFIFFSLLALRRITKAE